MAPAFKLLSLTLFLLAKSNCLEAQAKDTLFLRDGQLLIGKLKMIALGKADFDADHVDVVSVKTDEIRTISAATHIYKLQTIRQKLFYTHLHPGPEGKVTIVAPEGRQTLPMGEISQLIPFRDKTRGLWEGNASAGFTYTRSSDVGRFNADLTIGYTSRKIEIAARGSVITTSSDSSFAFENASASLLCSYVFNARWQSIIILSYQHNLELGLARRFQEGFAAGLSVVSSAHVQAKLLSGLVLSQEKSTDGKITPLQIELPVIFLFDFFHFRKPDITLNMTQSIYTGITQGGRFRQDGQLTLSWKIIRDFSVNLQLYDNFDNQPPGEDAAKLDYGVVFGLSYKFFQ